MNKPESSLSRKILVFNTTSRDSTGVALVVDGKVEQLVKPVRAQDLQELIDQLLSKARISFEEIDAVAVLNGPGSYTGTRMGVAAANTWGWLLDKPIIELDGDSLEIAIKQLKEFPQKTITQAKARY